MIHPTTPLTLARARKTAAVPSPCVGVCRMVPATGLCEGCWRNIDEIVAWGRASDTERLRIWGLIEARQAEAVSGS
ncbi:DUF1289 domain-containing protein [Hydrogenophaga atypica]|uniref:DUF1289 domain-containing protein n=1 Tax=Hydrogenophaga atypica TaxID=249409 RepID=A0ABW2QED2_9BURK